MNIAELIHQAALRYEFTPADIEVVEWDRTSPINGVPAARVLVEGMTTPDSGPMPDARMVLVRLKSLDVVLGRLWRDPNTGEAFRSDADVERGKVALMSYTLTDITRNPGHLFTAIYNALTVRLREKLAAEVNPPSPGTST